MSWPVTATPHIRERQIYLQSRAGKELVYLRKPRSRVYFAAYLGLLGVSVGGSVFQLIQYARVNGFRRQSLAVAAARRFTLYNVDTAPTSAPPHSPDRVHFRRPFTGATALPPISDAPSPGTFTPLGTPHARRAPPPPVRRRSSGALPRYKWLSGGKNTGDEPGVDVVDYSSNPEAEDTNVRVDFPGTRLASWLDSSAGQRPAVDGKPVGVRWIHVSGQNWEVMKTLALKFQLHPLAVEDALRSYRSPRSKIDFYKHHLYLQILVHHIHRPDLETLAKATQGAEDGERVTPPAGALEEAGHAPNGASWWPWQRSGQIRLPEGVENVFEPSFPEPLSLYKKNGIELPSRRDFIDPLSASYMIPVRKGIISVFMMHDGTLISLSAYEIHEALEPIYERLEDEHSILRRSGDASMLAHAILDITVDLAIEIMQTFEVKILKTEAGVLVHAELELVRRLHIIQAQLSRFRRQLTSLLHVCYVIRDQDAERTAAAGAFTLPRGAQACRTRLDGPPPSRHHPPSPGHSPVPSVHSPLVPQISLEAAVVAAAADDKEEKATGYFSPMARMYMNDVIDHLEMVVSSADQFVATCDHLTDYVFNVLSFNTNNSMERLSIVTVVFLPLTFIASYFGMNFIDFEALNNNVNYFWKVAGPCTVLFFIVFSYSYIVTGAQTLHRRVDRWKREKAATHAAEEAKKHLEGEA
ncbi:Cobalt/magnesium transport protein CorA [Vanrija pseudolonga]|uniref:Cobalt/magnesium transport protein CorA n=1 Tax=Vanrija pseudolonga TaxID=143232 RepID=A0AAF0YEU0_9TREE|nr:Cobalt/magnesium transport protein CorA [Vanrija pseudolonga]